MQISTQTTSTLSAEDVQARIGKLTASRMKDAMDFLKNGSESAKRKEYKMQLVAERLTGVIVSHYVTPAMQWGIDHEQEAKDAYTARTGNLIEPASFVDHNTIEDLGCTPDGYVGKLGLAECKCPTTTKYIEWIMAGVVPEEHKPQMIIQLDTTQRQWCDFVAFDPRMKNPDKRLFIVRYQPTETEKQIVIKHAEQFLLEVEALHNAVLS